MDWIQKSMANFCLPVFYLEVVLHCKVDWTFWTWNVWEMLSEKVPFLVCKLTRYLTKEYLKRKMTSFLHFERFITCALRSSAEKLRIRRYFGRVSAYLSWICWFLTNKGVLSSMFLILSDLDVEYIDGIYFKPLDTNSLEYLKKGKWGINHFS